MPGEASKAAAIIGAAEANDIGYPATPKSSLTLHIEAINNVCNMTGIPIAAIDGISRRVGRRSWLSISVCTPSTSTRPRLGAARLRCMCITRWRRSMPA